MSPRTLQRDDKPFVPVLYMAMELSNRNWKLLFGDGARRLLIALWRYLEDGVSPDGARLIPATV